MEKLQFDSFYKFLVSLGVVFIAIPFFFVNQMLSGKYDLILSQEDYDKLSTYSIQTLNFRTKVYIFASANKYLIFAGCALVVILGVLLVAFGLLRWYQNQKQLDYQNIYLTKKMKTESELAEASIIEIMDRAKLMNSAKSNMDHVNDTSELRDTLKIRDAFYKFLLKKYTGKDCTIYREMTIGDYYYDYIVSYNGNKAKTDDFLIEVKIVESVDTSIPAIKESISGIKDKLSEFTACMDDVLVPILYLITNEDDADSIKTIHALEEETGINIKTVSLKSLKHYME